MMSRSRRATRARRLSFGGGWARGPDARARPTLLRDRRRRRADSVRGRGRRLQRRPSHEELLARVSNDVRALVRLTDTSYIDSYGISLIFDAAARLRNRR